MVKKKLVLSDQFKKDLRIIGFLAGSWVLGLVLVVLANDDRLLGLIPVINYIAYRLEKELRNEGYIETIREMKK